MLCYRVKIFPEDITKKILHYQQWALQACRLQRRTGVSHFGAHDVKIEPDRKTCVCFVLSHYQIYTGNVSVRVKVELFLPHLAQGSETAEH